MAYADSSEIASEAAQLLGEKTITDITSTTNRLAVIFNEIYDKVRDHLLIIHDWHFASVVAQLTVDAVVDNYTPYLYAYDIPSAAVRIINIMYYTTGSYSRYSDAPYVPYLLQEGHLYTDESPCYVRYTANDKAVTAFPHLFGRALAAGLAYEASIVVTEDKNKRELIKQEFGGRLAEAMRVDGLEVKNYEIPSPRVEDVG